MISTQLRCLGFALVILSCALSQAADESNSIAPIEKFLDGQTILVARLDTGRVNFDAINQWFGQAGQGGADAAQELKPVRQWIENIRKSGGKSIYAVVSFGDTTSGIFYLLVPVENGVDAKALETAFASAPNTNQPKTARIGNVIALADEPTLEKLNHFSPAPRPDIGRALSEDPGAALAVAIVPSDDVRRVAEAVMPNLPKEFGGGPVTVLTHGLLWGTLNVHLPPNPSLKFVAQAQNADAAQGLAGLIRLVLRAGNQRRDAQETQLFSLLTRALTPDVQGDRVVIALGNDTLTNLAGALPGAMNKAQQRAATMESVNHIKQLLIASFMYAEDHNGQWPDTLEQAATTADTKQDLLIDPRHPNQHPAYVYHKPPQMNEIPNASRYVTVYDAVQDWPQGVAVGFADGHVEVLRMEADFRKLLDASKPKP